MSESQTEGQTVPKPEGHIDPKISQEPDDQAVPKPEGHIDPKIGQGPDGHIDPKIVDFGNQKKGNTKSVPQSIVITNNRNNELTWSTSIPVGKNWLRLSKLDGKVAAHNHETITVTVQAGSLVGVQEAILDFKFDDGSIEHKTVTVNFQ